MAFKVENTLHTMGCRLNMHRNPDLDTIKNNIGKFDVALQQIVSGFSKNQSKTDRNVKSILKDIEQLKEELKHVLDDIEKIESKTIEGVVTQLKDIDGLNVKLQKCNDYINKNSGNLSIIDGLRDEIKQLKSFCDGLKNVNESTKKIENNVDKFKEEIKKLGETLTKNISDNNDKKSSTIQGDFESKLNKIKDEIKDKMNQCEEKCLKKIKEGDDNTIKELNKVKNETNKNFNDNIDECKNDLKVINDFMDQNKNNIKNINKLIKDTNSCSSSILSIERDEIPKLIVLRSDLTKITTKMGELKGIINAHASEIEDVKSTQKTSLTNILKNKKKIDENDVILSEGLDDCKNNIKKHGELIKDIEEKIKDYCQVEHNSRDIKEGLKLLKNFSSIYENLETNYILKSSLNPSDVSGIGISTNSIVKSNDNINGLMDDVYSAIEEANNKLKKEFNQKISDISGSGINSSRSPVDKSKKNKNDIEKLGAAQTNILKRVNSNVETIVDLYNRVNKVETFLVGNDKEKEYEKNVINVDNRIKNNDYRINKLKQEKFFITDKSSSNDFFLGQGLILPYGVDIFCIKLNFEYKSKVAREITISKVKISPSKDNIFIKNAKTIIEYDNDPVLKEQIIEKISSTGCMIDVVYVPPLPLEENTRLLIKITSVKKCDLVTVLALKQTEEI